MISKTLIPKEKRKGKPWLHFAMLFISMSITAVYGLLIAMFAHPITAFLKHCDIPESIVPISILLVWGLSALVVYIVMRKD